MRVKPEYLAAVKEEQKRDCFLVSDGFSLQLNRERISVSGWGCNDSDATRMTESEAREWFEVIRKQMISDDYLEIRRVR